MNTKQWLISRAAGFGDLTKDDLDPIMYFSLLWSLFEAEALNNNASSSKICKLVTKWDRAGTLRFAGFTESLAYFKNRYFANGALTYYFQGLRLRPGDCPKLVEAVITGENTGEANSVIALLVIVYRLRNNLFHGEKWAYALRGQRGNFRHANLVLMKALENTIADVCP